MTCVAMACTEKRKVFGEAFLRQHVRDILGFYDAVAVDSDAGGFHNQLLDDGSNYDAATKHVVGTCRFVVNYALAAELCDGEEAALHLSRCVTRTARLQPRAPLAVRREHALSAPRAAAAHMPRHRERRQVCT